LYNIDRPKLNQNLVRTADRIQSGLAHRVYPNDKRIGINPPPLKSHHLCGVCSQVYVLDLEGVVW